MSWLSENIGTIIICAVLVVIVAAVIRSMIKSKRTGKYCCGGNCSCCGSACQKKDE